MEKRGGSQLSELEDPPIISLVCLCLLCDAAVLSDYICDYGHRCHPVVLFFVLHCCHVLSSTDQSFLLGLVDEDAVSLDPLCCAGPA